MLEVPDPGAGIVVGLKVTVAPVGVHCGERHSAVKSAGTNCRDC